MYIVWMTAQSIIWECRFKGWVKTLLNCYNHSIKDFKSPLPSWTMLESFQVCCFCKSNVCKTSPCLMHINSTHNNCPFLLPSLPLSVVVVWFTWNLPTLAGDQFWNLGLMSYQKCWRMRAIWWMHSLNGCWNHVWCTWERIWR